jgi:hypothetical protein
MALLLATLRAIDGSVSRRRWAVAGVLAALVALTRPDGIIYALLPPGLALAEGRRSKGALGAYALAFLAIFAPFLASRLAIFGSLVPNTAVAKGEPGLREALDLLLFDREGLSKVDRVLEAAIASPFTNVVLLLAAVGFLRLHRKGQVGEGLRAILVFGAAAAVVYMLLPADWMREHRFATPFFPLYYAWVFAVIDVSLTGVLIRRQGRLVGLVASALLLTSVPDFAGRARAFATTTNISLFFVRAAFAERFDRYARMLRVPSASVLLPELGGMLLWSHARVYDLAGLCDREIARAVSTDPTSAHEYILGRARPTFIHVYGRFSEVALERDPRFERDYVPICAYGTEEDADRRDHASGIYVRRDAVQGPEGEAALEAMRAEKHARILWVPPPPSSWLLGWLLQTPLVPEKYRSDSPTLAGEGGAAAH